MTSHTHIDAASPVDCDRFDALLADWLEGTLPPGQRAAAESHRKACERCRTLADDLVAISRDAAALPPIEPARDLWTGIAARIETPVVPLDRTGEHAARHAAHGGSQALRVHRFPHFSRSRRWLAAAAGVLVAVSVGSTYAVMRAAGGDAAPTLASNAPAAPNTSDAPAAPRAPADSAPDATLPNAVAPAAPEASAPRTFVAERAEAPRPNAGAAPVYAPAITTYDREIASLRAALRNRNDLDTATAIVLDRSLRVIDAAIAESRRALARDPNSRLLGDQLTRALDQKVELLRTAVLLPSRS